ncbi:MAG: ABC transporter substrate-binding protein, partial [Planctomycetes bacterium]|nr:ABC transporter substrate-binding protein [Planctomycetota bacterium]
SNVSCQQPKLEKVKIASGGHIVHFLPLDIAVAKGFFTDEGLAPEITQLDGGTATAQALLAEQVDFSLNSIDHAFKAAVQGKDNLRMIELLNQIPGMVLVVDSRLREKVKNIADLKGMTLGVTSKGSATHMVLASLLSKSGINPDNVNIINAGSATFPPALENGQIAGGIALEPFASILVEQGKAFVLADLNTLKDTERFLGGPYNQAGVMTRQDMIARRPDLVQKIVNIHVRALKWIQAHTPQEIAEALPREVVGTDKERYVKTLEKLREFYSPDGEINPRGVANVLVSMQASGSLVDKLRNPPSDFYTDTFISESSKNRIPSQSSSPPSGKNTVTYNWITLHEFWLILLGSLIGGIIGYFASLLAGRGQTKELKNLREESKKIDFIESLDEFAEKVLANAKNAKEIVLFCIPSPLLFSFQDAGFKLSDAENSDWWKKFAGQFIVNLTRDGKLTVKLVILNDESLRKYAKDLFSDDRKANDQLQVVNVFLEKLKSCCNLTVDRTFNITSWMFITDFHLEKITTATVGFTDPGKVQQEKLTKHLPNEQLAKMLTGIVTTDKYAVEFFRHSFDDLVSRHYFCEVVEEIKSQLSRDGIDIAFIQKWEKELDSAKNWAPSEVIVREKRS